MWILWHQKLEEGSQTRQVWYYALSVYPPHFFLESKDIWVDDLRSSHHTWKAIKKMFGWNGRGSQLALGAKELGPLWISTRKKKTCGVIGCWKSKGGKVVTVHGRNPAPVEVGSFSHYLQGFIHSRWCKISSINSTTPGRLTWRLLENHHECFDRRYIDSFIFFVVGFS